MVIPAALRWLFLRLIHPRAEARGVAPAALPAPPAPVQAGPRPRAESPAIPAPVRVARTVLAARAMVQAANTLSTTDDVPAHLQITLHYPDGLAIMLDMALIALDDDEVPDDGH